MSAVFPDRHLVARKLHACFYCNEKIVVGEKYGRRAFAVDGDFGEMKFHLECDHNAVEVQKWDNDDYEGFEPGTMQRPPKLPA